MTKKLPSPALEALPEPAPAAVRPAARLRRTVVHRKPRSALAAAPQEPPAGPPNAPLALGQLPWPELRLRLTTPDPPTLDALRLYYGPAELDELLTLARAVPAASPPEPGPEQPSIVLIPGLMGSGLLVESQEPLWVHLPRLATEGVGALRLPAAASAVQAGPVEYRLYTHALLRLSQAGPVHPFAYDWRLDLGLAAEQLARYLRQEQAGRPVHLVAHGAGGLVARLCIARHPDLWEQLRGPAGNGGRLVLLGTPNFGTFAAVQVLTGADKLVRWLAKLDLRNSLPEVLSILNTFPSTYQLLPAPDKLPPSLRVLYQRGAWGEFPVHDALLTQARAFHAELAAAPATIDPARMVCVTGYNRRTLAGLDLLGPGEFRYHETLAGDGRVPLELGQLPGVATYFVEEDHGRLPRNPLVLKAVLELLELGHTSTLPQEPGSTRSLATRAGHWHRPIGEDLVATRLEKLTRGAVRPLPDEPTPQTRLEQQAIEDTLLRAAAGEERPTYRLDQLGGRTAAVVPLPLLLRLVCEPVTAVKTPVLLMGRYKGAPLTRRLAQVDQALDFWISQASDQAMLGGELGQISFIPARHKERLAARAVLLAGMGEEGRFTHHDLRYLLTNVVSAVVSLGYRQFAGVVLGTRAGTMSEERALLSFLQGTCDALHRPPTEPTAGRRPARLSSITLIARDLAQFHSLGQVLTRLAQDQPIEGLRIDLDEASLAATPAEPGPPDPAAGTPPSGLLSPETGPRITIERSGSRFRFSALVDGSVIPVREVEAQAFFPGSISTRLMESATREEQETYGQLLTTALFPADFQELLAEPLTFILDRDTASLPWEMACFSHERRPGTQYFGPELQLTRQFRTMLSPKPGLPPPRNHSLRVLVVADPAPEPEFQLPGARREGRAVVQALSRIKQYAQLDIDVVERIGDAECEPLEIQALLLNGNFDVVHFAGHGVFDAEHPARGGWVFGHERVVSAREIFQARRVPRLVFANACFSAVVNARVQPLSAEELNRNLAGIAEAFFERGVRNYIGTGWPVNDALAVAFAQEFYAQALLSCSARELRQLSERGEVGTSAPLALGKALAASRTCIVHQGSTWGAYQHYGQANDLLIS